MKPITILGFFTVAFVLSFTASSAHAESVPTPLQQERDGVQLAEIICSVGRTLMQSPSGSPACIFAESIDALIARGFVQIGQVADVIAFIETKPATIPTELVSANNAFAISFYKQIADGYNDGNHFFSPLSMHVAFSVLYEGAHGETAKQIRDVFGIIEDDVARHQTVSDTMSSLNYDDPDAIFEMANSLWLADWLVPREPYVDIARSTYRADVKTVDFTDEGKGGAVYLINRWADEKTYGKITRVLDPRDTGNITAAAILNAIYFKGTWVNQFDEEGTYKSDFWTGNTDVEADFMNTMAEFKYAETDSVQILQMPYEGDRLSMLIVLPFGMDEMASLEEDLTAATVDAWGNLVSYKYVDVSIPKFDVKTRYDLIEPLQHLGITDVFYAESSDLSGIGAGNLYIDKATQDAYVSVNEEGATAAAVTVLTTKLMMPPSFIANHPFLFLIQDDESGMILFMGKIVDPTS